MQNLTFILLISKCVYIGKVPRKIEGGAHKMGGGQMIFPKNGGSVDAIDHFWGSVVQK